MDLEPLARVLADELARRPTVVAPEYLTPEQAHQLSQIPVKTLEMLRAQRKGPPFLKIGRAVRYKTTELRSWIEREGSVWP